MYGAQGLLIEFSDEQMAVLVVKVAMANCTKLKVNMIRLKTTVAACRITMFIM